MASVFNYMPQDFGFFPDKEQRIRTLARKARIPLHDDEELFAVYHQTLHVLAKHFGIALAVILIPGIPLVRYGLFGQYRGLYFLLVLIAFAYFAKHLTIWFLNSYIITSHRLIKISHEGLFKKLILETPLDRILNVSYKTTGIASSIFGYGDVEVQVVGLMEPMILKHIGQPAQIKDYLWKAHLEFSGKRATFDAEKISHIQQQIGYTKENQRVL